MKFNLKHLEEQLRIFFEDQLKLINVDDPIYRLSNDLLDILNNNIKQVSGKKFIPNIYRISLKDEHLFNNKLLDAWKKFISEIISDMSQTEGMELSGPIHIQFFYNTQLDNDFFIEISHSVFTSGKTIRMVTEDEPSDFYQQSIQAFLITPDDSLFTINKKIINIGRSEENDLVIDNLRVSRVHAQIREIKSRHIIFDLDSTTGIKINNHRVNQVKLSNGDVIEIGDVPLIYIIESTEDQITKIKDTTKFNSI